MSPEYQRRIGGSHGGASVAARIWPTTRARKSASSAAMTVAYAAASSTGDALGGESRVPANVVQATGRVVVVSDEIQIRLIRARHTVLAQGKPLGIRSDAAT